MPRTSVADRPDVVTDPLRRLAAAGLITGITDGAFSSLLNVFAYGSTATRLFQGVAATVLGRAALDGGLRTAAVGVLMHFGVAFGWSAVFLALALRSARLRHLLTTRYGAIKIGSVYGPLIWTVMSLVVIPLLVARPTPIGARWWIQFFGHIPFVGIPIVSAIGRNPGRTWSSRA